MYYTLLFIFKEIHIIRRERGDDLNEFAPNTVLRFTEPFALLLEVSQSH